MTETLIRGFKIYHSVYFVPNDLDFNLNSSEESYLLESLRVKDVKQCLMFKVINESYVSFINLFCVLFLSITFFSHLFTENQQIFGKIKDLHASFCS